MSEPLVWSRCNQCKGDLDFDETYYACSVSTCNRKGTEFRFCSVECWDAHVPVMRHRDAWAEERRSPTKAEWLRENPAEESAHAAQAGTDTSTPVATPLAEADVPREVLVVVSKLKAYVRARSGLNTSDGVLEVLSDRIRRLCDDAARNAVRAGRRTVLDRDVP